MKTNFTTRLCLVCIGTLSIGSLAAAAIQESDNQLGETQVAKSIEPAKAADSTVGQTDQKKANQTATHDPFYGDSSGDPFGTSTASASSQIFASEAENNRRLEVKLDSAYNLPAFVAVPLNDAIDAISKEFKIPTYIDTSALEDEAISTETEVDWNLTNVRLRTALTMILDSKDLTYIIKDGILIITTKERAEFRQTLKIYDCQNFCETQMLGLTTEQQLKELISLLESTVEPLSWEINGGPTGAVITPFRKKLIVRNTEAIHHDLQLLLEELAR